MAMPIQEFLNAFVLMKSSIVHHDHAFSLKTWDQGVFAPVIKYTAINVGLKVIKRK